jgi:hypothetical protein
MRPIKLENFRIDARHIAELQWGEGGTNAMRTNRNGAYYYSCSGHGGYVVDARCLTEAEKEALKPYLGQCAAYRQPLNVLVATNPDSGNKYVYGVDYQNFYNYSMPRSKTFYVPLSMPREWVPFDVYMFEEDCAWAILEKFTDIATKWQLEKFTPAERKASAEDTFQRWFGDKKEGADAPVAQQ